MLLKRNVFRVLCALFYLPVALLSMFEIINLVMTNSQNRYFLVGGVVFGVLLFLIAAYFIKQKKPNKKRKLKNKNKEITIIIRGNISFGGLEIKD